MPILSLPTISLPKPKNSPSISNPQTLTLTMASNSDDSKLKIPQKHHFQSGALVEISPDDDGFRGSWYTGKVIRRASSKNPDNYLVQYDNLFNDETGKNRLREILNWAQLRPVAPREKKRQFKFGEKVDAYHNDGWWEGSITSELEDGKFAVFFRGTREQIAFGEEDLRLHREWVDGQWKPPLEEEASELEDTEKEKQMKEEVGKKEQEGLAMIPKKLEPIEVVMEKFTRGMPVEVSMDEEGLEGAWFEATIVEAVGKDTYLVEYKTLRTEDDTDFLREEIDTGHIRPCPPERVIIDRFEVLDEVDALYNDAWWVGIIRKVLSDSKYIVHFRESNEEIKFRHSELRLHQDWIAGKWMVPSLVVSR